MLAFVSTNKILQIFYRKRTVPVALCKILLGLSKSSSSHHWTVISSIESSAKSVYVSFWRTATIFSNIFN